MSRVLVVDDDDAIRMVVAQALRCHGHVVTTAETLAELDRALAREVPDVLVTDVVLPDGDGLSHLAGVTARHPELPVIVLSAQNTLTTAVRATEAGAYEYLPKPFDLEVLAQAVAAAAGRGATTPNQLPHEDHSLPLIGRSAAMQDVYRVIARVVATDLTVLVTGESGTGKELVARAIHDLGARRGHAFVALNMAAIPRELIEAELFGHERGAFTGAHQRSAGRFEQAAGGTLFLDEIGDMPMEAQTRLLRVLQTGEFNSVGSGRTLRADVRIVAATNRDLAAQVASGQFREDLYYRLAVVPVALPPLRERREDVALLARYFLDRVVGEGLPRRQLSAAATEALVAHDWPGNVRELENAIRRLAVFARDEVIEADAIRAMLGAPRPSSETEALDVAGVVVRLVERIGQAEEPGTLYDRVIGAVERPLIELVLARHGYNQLRAAKALGINRNTLRKRLDDLAIRLPGE